MKNKSNHTQVANEGGHRRRFPRVAWPQLRRFQERRQVVVAFNFFIKYMNAKYSLYIRTEEREWVERETLGGREIGLEVRLLRDIEWVSVMILGRHLLETGKDTSNTTFDQIGGTTRMYHPSISHAFPTTLTRRIYGIISKSGATWGRFSSQNRETTMAGSTVSQDLRGSTMSRD